ncbi:MAG: tRNA pseudouridine(38-40) synthase TruA [Bacteroidales bacterium]|jgi:tRNA pseudouridine38-40 synthase|nr:tRNA pseudouridine(38-40) synthase TruA [Bacteroidales bacterium]MDD4218014.1 tRNA pseudouridine(38-40) synthase TruA [Bacteroidales bacterium]MDY0144242.1 tRNA pseudouridine(38-40) synthase TruA [Bacteroidales bacterium]
MRYKIELSYFGRDFHGWQRQLNAISVQQTIEDAINVVFRDEIMLIGCGRTDTGVHARKYIAHFDSDKEYNNDAAMKLNNYLPFSIAIHSIESVSSDFHARFNAVKRTYQYQICLTKNPFFVDSAWLIYQHLDVNLMNIAAEQLFKYTDFTSFSKLHTDVKTNNCDVQYAKFELNENVLIFTIIADRFLRNMVRAIVGTLIDVGKGKINIDEFSTIIEAKDRSEAGQSAPAHGLFLVDVTYP